MHCICLIAGDKVVSCLHQIPSFVCFLVAGIIRIATYEFFYEFSALIFISQPISTYHWSIYDEIDESIHDAAMQQTK